MGLTPDYEPLNSTDHPFVAVEFDIYSNSFDPPDEHVGIDINSMESVANVRWWSNVSIMEGRKHDTWINYDSASKNPSMVFTGFINYTYIRQRLSYIIDLREYLPELVTFGFSDATGNASAPHGIYSWSFSSTLEIHGYVTDPNFSRNKNGNTGPGIVIAGSNSGKHKTRLVIGLTVLGSVLLGGLGLLIFAFWKKRRRMMNEADEIFDVTIGDELIQGSGPKKFSYNEPDRATNKFDQQEKLGEGGFGGVYKGFLKEINSYVAVKKVSKGSRQGT